MSLPSGVPLPSELLGHTIRRLRAIHLKGADQLGDGYADTDAEAYGLVLLKKRAVMAEKAREQSQAKYQEIEDTIEREVEMELALAKEIENQLKSLHTIDPDGLSSSAIRPLNPARRSIKKRATYNGANSKRSSFVSSTLPTKAPEPPRSARGSEGKQSFEDDESAPLQKVNVHIQNSHYGSVHPSLFEEPRKSSDTTLAEKLKQRMDHYLAAQTGGGDEKQAQERAAAENEERWRNVKAALLSGTPGDVDKRLMENTMSLRSRASVSESDNKGDQRSGFSSTTSTITRGVLPMRAPSSLESKQNNSSSALSGKQLPGLPLPPQNAGPVDPNEVDPDKLPFLQFTGGTRSKSPAATRATRLPTMSSSTSHVTLPDTASTALRMGLTGSLSQSRGKWDSIDYGAPSFYSMTARQLYEMSRRMDKQKKKRAEYKGQLDPYSRTRNSGANEGEKQEVGIEEIVRKQEEQRRHYQELIEKLDPLRVLRSECNYTLTGDYNGNLALVGGPRAFAGPLSRDEINPEAPTNQPSDPPSDQPQAPANQTFVTGIDLGELSRDQAEPQSPAAAFSMESVAQKELDRVSLCRSLDTALEAVPSCLGLRTMKLPSTVPMPEILELTQRHLPLSDEWERRIWTHYFQCASSQLVLQDAFWYLVCTAPEWAAVPLSKPTLSGKPTYGLSSIAARTCLELQPIIMDRMSKNFVTFFLSLPVERKDDILELYADGLAQTIFYALARAFPQSHHKLSSEFRTSLSEMASDWVMGESLSAQHIGCAHWLDATSPVYVATLINKAKALQTAGLARLVAGGAGLAQTEHSNSQSTLSNNSAEPNSYPNGGGRRESVHPGGPARRGSMMRRDSFSFTGQRHSVVSLVGNALSPDPRLAVRPRTPLKDKLDKFQHKSIDHALADPDPPRQQKRVGAMGGYGITLNTKAKVLQARTSSASKRAQLQQQHANSPRVQLPVPTIPQPDLTRDTSLSDGEIAALTQLQKLPNTGSDGLSTNRDDQSQTTARSSAFGTSRQQSAGSSAVDGRRRQNSASQRPGQAGRPGSGSSRVSSAKRYRYRLATLQQVGKGPVPEETKDAEDDRRSRVSESEADGVEQGGVGSARGHSAGAIGGMGLEDDPYADNALDESSDDDDDDVDYDATNIYDPTHAQKRQARIQHAKRSASRKKDKDNPRLLGGARAGQRRSAPSSPTNANAASEEPKSLRRLPTTTHTNGAESDDGLTPSSSTDAINLASIQGVDGLQSIQYQPGRIQEVLDEEERHAARLIERVRRYLPEGAEGTEQLPPKAKKLKARIFRKLQSVSHSALVQHFLSSRKIKGSSKWFVKLRVSNQKPIE